VLLNLTALTMPPEIYPLNKDRFYYYCHYYSDRLEPSGKTAAKPSCQKSKLTAYYNTLALQGKVMLAPKPFFAIASFAILFAAASPAQAVHPPLKPKHLSAVKVKPFDKALLKPASLNAQAPAEYRVRFVTTAGNFTLKATRAWAPKGADRFYNLVQHHFYDNTAFFRVLPGFMAQFGMSAHPRVSRAWEQATIEDDPVVQSNRAGYVAFAMAGPDTRTTQVFINYNNNESLDQSGFAPFAAVETGMEVVNKLYSGYGEGSPSGEGPDQSQIKTHGQVYLKNQFPKLDAIRSATLLD
jgi:peptidyl-prolyl cis-trans isomerase A (cyclophilin A)